MGAREAIAAGLFYLGQRSFGETLRAEAVPPVNAISAAASATIATRSSTRQRGRVVVTFYFSFPLVGRGRRE